MSRLRLAALGLAALLFAPPAPAWNFVTHRVIAAMFTISYPCAVLMSVLSGYLWDKTDIAWIAFVPIGSAAAALAVLPLGIDLGHRSPATRR